MEILGWVGSFLFAICGIPAAVQTYRDGHARGMNTLFLLLWCGGEVLTLSYVIYKRDYPLILNYLSNLGSLLVIMKYKIWERL